MTLNKTAVSTEQQSTIAMAGGNRIGVIDNVLFVIFESFPKHVLAEIFNEGLKVYRRVNRPLVILVLLSPAAEPPDRSFLEENLRFIREGKGYFAKIVAVLQGSGMKQAFIRALASNVVLALNDRGNLAVADTVTNALLASQEHLQLSPAEIMAKAASLGFLL